MEAIWVALPWFRVSRLLNSNIIDHGLNIQICGIAILGPRFHSRFRSVSLFGFRLVCGIAILGPRFHSWFHSVSLFGFRSVCGIDILGPRFHSRFRSVSLFGFRLVGGIVILGPWFHSRFHSLDFAWFVELQYYSEGQVCTAKNG